MIEPIYTGPERRRHAMYVTRNTEYHFRDALCVAVRDLRTGRWLASHLAVGRRLGGGVRVASDGQFRRTERPQAGDSIFFDDAARELLTSSVANVERPSRAQVDAYPTSRDAGCTG